MTFRNAERWWACLCIGMLSMAAGCGLVELIVEIVDGLEPLCLESSQCEEGEFCRFDSRGCGVGDKLGECAPRPEACAEIYAPVCGCDGITYPNECQAWAQGARIERDGVCEPALLCGGIAGVPCDDGEYCSFEIGTCGAADQSGLCEAIPVVCTEEYAPVCGCDEATYSNACIAARAEISILRIGECDAGPG